MNDLCVENDTILDILSSINYVTQIDFTYFFKTPFTVATRKIETTTRGMGQCKLFVLAFSFLYYAKHFPTFETLRWLLPLHERLFPH